jgi:alkylhydroperoxidase family enzyme
MGGGSAARGVAPADRRLVRHTPGMTANYELAFAERPDVYAAWVALSASVQANMDLRRYELATFAAALRLRSSYCSLAHGRMLAEQFDEPVLAIVRDRQAAGLSAVDLAVMAFAERVADDASTIDDAARQPLRDLGLCEAEIMDVVLAASVRCFFSKALDGLGALPDAEFRTLAPELQDALVVGRPIAES